MTDQERKDLESVMSFLKWDVDRKKIINFIKEYLIWKI